ncbi:MAG: hypothetical protein GWO16_14405 [Gammaproteobacteria bacterium]|nr:hypothetical protein [Gammaproteobacteria bacterium]NIR97482.1 hypothetical protein [Gammaproteobacteria bacterium]NIT64753.1 hypothetical protein [Gammaproteobacteria bacterium]NIV21714.1 hypothetical protein [Gammaproteobacteria bacterium]NIY33333.1 hypothetical protein [Gammaproteobacteria bacterium]
MTHLPQIAALGSGHLRVVKHAQEGQTYTTAETLDDEAKVQEVARLLSGVEITPHSLASAAEMVSRGREESA